ncbi:carbohydrate ABC transporter permease [Actinomyces urogenitalis]|uniref:carbohydrate ABC transporter permease n=2 Tax=Actinomyces urogenitalis TaxID=103621 RepID=UPI0018CC8171|nr:carbohydrate ABC transporter permease [Actinomyces urogenitalis]MBS6071927.1 carbohydrate ABC transporter permease [Actinomyces urogenitalis]MDK8238052.1 carbohydrate ABC transporter permease [Actinomyces urogenitalis]MDU5874943.1 carbohydrate ABC transporter permease [Actinomyces urogenitalis]MDU7429183.1 carbohydrate ABC transporter permease [Actinomyces urogenitalis]WOO95474.1 carbohydrate ABC transporter permease [Actinomyces urogenitalis]
MLALLAVFSGVPIIILVMNALKTSAEVSKNPLGFPRDLTFANFPEAWSLGNYGTTILNSAIITACTVVGVWIVSGTAAYALARLDVPRGGVVLMYLFVCTAIPQQIFLVPLFFLWAKLGLTDSLFGLIVIYVALFSPFATLLLRSYMMALPREFEEAARTEGAGELRILFSVVLPLTLPGFLTVALVSGLMAWNEFLFAITFIQDDALKPVTTSFLAFKGQFTQDWGLTSAGALFVIAPVIILFLFMQKKFVEGLAAGGLK